MRLQDIRNRKKHQDKMLNNTPSKKSEGQLQRYEEKARNLIKKKEDYEEAIQEYIESSEDVRSIRSQIEENDHIIAKHQEINKMLVASGQSFIDDLEQEYRSANSFDAEEYCRSMRMIERMYKLSRAVIPHDIDLAIIRAQYWQMDLDKEKLQKEVDKQ